MERDLSVKDEYEFYSKIIFDEFDKNPSVKDAYAAMKKVMEDESVEEKIRNVIRKAIYNIFSIVTKKPEKEVAEQQPQ